MARGLLRSISQLNAGRQRGPPVLGTSRDYSDRSSGSGLQPADRTGGRMGGPLARSCVRFCSGATLSTPAGDTTLFLRTHPGGSDTRFVVCQNSLYTERVISL